MPGRPRHNAPAVMTAALLAAAPASAQQPTHDQQPMHGMHMPDDPASQAYMQTMQAMNQGMMQPMSGDADRDFATMMIAHHQGAIDMAQVLLEHGKDERLKQMARKIIDDQTKEIQEFRKWLEEHPDSEASR